LAPRGPPDGLITLRRLAVAMADADTTPILREDSCDARRASGALGRRLATGSLVCALGLACLLATSALYTRRGRAAPAGGSVGSSLGLHETGIADVMGDPHLKAFLAAVKEKGAHLRTRVREQINYVKSVERRDMTNTTAVRLAGLHGDGAHGGPTMNRHDGNVCADDEELLDNLCYKRCSDLTEGAFPIRTTAFSCCEARPCGVFNQKVSLKVCGGFDVAGGSRGSACPHVPGACLEDEELHLGRCYKKCSILTDFQFPFRIAAATCCKIDSKVMCADAPLVRTSPSYNVGGVSNRSDPEAPTEPHWPIPALTEEAAPPRNGTNTTNTTPPLPRNGTNTTPPPPRNATTTAAPPPSPVPDRSSAGTGLPTLLACCLLALQSCTTNFALPGLQ